MIKVTVNPVPYLLKTINRYLLIVFILTSGLISAQNLDKEQIKNSGEYYWGEANSQNELEADDEALSMLTKQIAVTISSSFEGIVAETNNNIQESARKVINTYSSATLKDVKTISLLQDGRVQVFKYIAKSEVTKIFDSRLKLINNIFVKAKEYEEKNNLAYALKWYYFCLILRNSIPATNAVYEGVNFDTELSSRINNIISSIEFTLVDDKMVSENERELKINLTMQGKPVQMLDFSFWDGTGQLNIAAVDGVGIVKLFGSSIKFDKLDLSVKYSYYESRFEIKEVGDLWNCVIKPAFRNSKQLKLIIEKPKPEEKPVVQQEKKAPQDEKLSVQSDTTVHNAVMGKYSLNLSNKENCPVLDKISQSALKFVDMLGRHSLQEMQKTYTEESLKNKLASLFKYNNPQPFENEMIADINKTSFGWELRKIKLLNNYSSIKKQSTEYLILDFDNNGELYDVSFGITEGLYNEFLDQAKFTGDWGNRQVIMKFIERYRTAFLTRDIAMLDSLFAEDAVIIIGKVLQKKPASEMYKYIKLNDQQPEVAYMYYTKTQYLKSQKQVFQNQKDLYVGYSTFKINKKNNTPGVYGVSMRQNYNATSYSDEGYLFLLIDFNEDLPQIYVRSWQPQEWDDDALIKLSNFNLNK